MDIATSLKLAVVRSDDPTHLEKMALGLDMLVWGTLLAMLACIVGPLYSQTLFSPETFSIMVGGILSAIGVFFMLTPATRDWWCRQPDGRNSRLILIPLGSAALVAPSLMLRLPPQIATQHTIFASFLVAGVVWFLGECAKLRFLEKLAIELGGNIAREARQLRWGIYAAVALLAVTLSVGLIAARLDGRSLPDIHGACLAMAAVSLLTFSILGILLYHRLSATMKDRILQSRQIRQSVPDEDLPRSMLWEKHHN